MTAHLSISAERTELPQLRRRIIGAYRRAQEIIAKASSVSSSSRTHGLTHVYEKVCEHMRGDITQASDSFPNADAFLVWLLDDSDGIILERDRTGLGLAVRAVMEEIKKPRNAL